MKKIGKLLLIIIVSLVYLYLLLPAPVVPPLPDSLKSTEPGDTIEIPGVSAFYTDTSRAEVVAFYQKAFSRSGFLNLPLPVLTLNYPPEYAKEAIRDTTESTFLYELVHPGRDSLYISGWDPSEDPNYKRAKDPRQVLEKEGRYYERKITLRLIQAEFVWRILIFTLGLVIFRVIFFQLKRIIVSLWRQR